MLEGLRAFLGLEVQLDDQVLAVVDGTADPFSEDASLPSCVGETVKRSFPGAKVCDRVLNAQGEHDRLLDRLRRLKRCLKDSPIASASERDLLGQEAVSLCPPRDRAAELDGVERDLFTGVASGEVASSWAGEGESERLAVASGPFGNDIGDDAAVVARGELEVASSRSGDVDSVHPRV